MALTVTLEFSEQELDYFRSRMHQVRGRNEQRPPQGIAAAALAEVERLVSARRHLRNFIGGRHHVRRRPTVRRSRGGSRAPGLRCLPQPFLVQQSGGESNE